MCPGVLLLLSTPLTLDTRCVCLTQVPSLPLSTTLIKPS